MTKMLLPRPLPIQPEELEILSPPQRLSVAEWAEQYRKLSPKTTHYHGNWSHEYTPFAVEPMEALSDIGTRQVTVEACTQSAKTEIGLNFLGRVIEQSPGPFLNVMPREDDANRRVSTRIRPMFESTPSLLKHLGGDLERINSGRETILDNMIMYLAWAGSAAALADNPVCYVWLDEVGKFPVKSGKEADPVSLTKDRQRTFFSKSKLYCDSSPVLTGDLIDREFNEGDQRADWIKCPYCKQRHVPKWTYIELDKDSVRNLLSPRDYESGKCARYICPNCEKRWSEMDRWAAVCTGVWAPRDCKVDSNGRIIGKVFSNPHKSYRITAFMLYPGFITASQLASDWAKAQVARKAGDIGPLQNFINSQLAEPFHEAEKETEENKLTIHIGSHKPQTIPPGVQLITAAADVQIDHIYIQAIGWGYLSESWVLFEARLETGDTSQLENYVLLDEFLMMSFPFAENNKIALPITMAGIDCGYRPDVVFDFCRRSPVNVVPVRGDDSVRSRVFRASKVAGGTMIRYDLNVNVIKDNVFRMLFESQTPGPGFMHLHAETNEDVLNQLASEHQIRIRKGSRSIVIWVKKDSHRANHFLDLTVYNTFIAELAGARMLRDPNKPRKRLKLSEIQAEKRR